MNRTTDRPIDPDRLAELEEERRFLLRSLADLEREHAAGDVDDDDYAELRDGYTVRAAATLREIELGRAALPPKPPANWRRRIAIAIATIGLIVIVWLILVATSAQRLGDESLTGADPRSETQLLLAAARAQLGVDPAAAAELYADVLEREPDHVEALTYHGWTTWLSATTQDEFIAAATDLSRATELDPRYPDPWCFLGIAKQRLGEDAAARPDLERCLELNPPADVRGLVEGLLARLTDTAPTTAATSAP